MKVFKFGGASIKDADAVRNMCNIVEHYSNDKLLIVVSAMGKSTNALEKILELCRNKENFEGAIDSLNTFHQDIIKDLFGNKNQDISTEVSAIFKELSNYLNAIDSLEGRINESYDWVVSTGEIVSSKIIQQYLEERFPIVWLNARSVLKTDNSFREAKVNWDLTRQYINDQVRPILEKKVIITQGFIGSTRNDKPTTLGREGSDFTGAIFANCLNAESLTIWKDVPGILNADPKIIKDAEKYEQLSYSDAAEMTYYGASVIHPKTIKPLTSRNIPLLVRSFTHPFDKGTVIDGHESTKNKPAIIFKKNQSLITFGVRDFTFINERNLSLIFHTLDLLNIKINLMQNSAISFSICIDNQPWKIESLIKKLSNDFDLKFNNNNLTLISVKNYIPENIEKLSKEKEIYLEQRTQKTFQIVVKS